MFGLFPKLAAAVQKDILIEMLVTNSVLQRDHLGVRVTKVSTPGSNYY